VFHFTRHFFACLSLFLFNGRQAGAQPVAAFADSIRSASAIPELAYAVVSSDSVFVCAVTGERKRNSPYPARPEDRFHIGSNTKAITALMAAVLIQQGKLHWDTRFLDLFPELSAHSNPAYRDVTLQQLLAFRGLLPPYTYTFTYPLRTSVKGKDNQEQRKWLAAYFLTLAPAKPDSEGLTPSNADYILAGLMLEKAAGMPYKELLERWGRAHQIHFGFGYPNRQDTLQTWGHDQDLQPVAPFDHYKLEWLLSAGNVNLPIADYGRLIQIFMQGLRHGTDGMPPSVYRFLISGMPGFAMGWFNSKDPETGHTLAWNEGNAGAFISQVYLCPEADRAYILLSNAATEKAGQGLSELADMLMDRYGE